MTLSRRLQAALSYTKGFYQLHDVGCDHAYLPIASLEAGFIDYAIASDNKPEPLENAKQNISLSTKKDSINLLLSEGLEELSPSTDVVSILGMGGNMISDILNLADLKNVKRLILSPNSDADIVRKTLQPLGFAIVDEDFLSDKGKYYVIIVAERGNAQYSDIELRFGPIVLKKKNDVFQTHIRQLISQRTQAKEHAKKIETIQLLESEIALLKGVLE